MRKTVIGGWLLVEKTNHQLPITSDGFTAVLP
jgi:hypothetical protein